MNKCYSICCFGVEVWRLLIQTGAMYSSVPTKEFDARIGSAIKTGACWALDCFFFSFVVGSKSCRIAEFTSREVLWLVNENFTLYWCWTIGIPEVYKTSNMTSRNPSRQRVHCLVVEHSRALDPGKLSLKRHVKFRARNLVTFHLLYHKPEQPKSTASRYCPLLNFLPDFPSRF